MFFFMTGVLQFLTYFFDYFAWISAAAVALLLLKWVFSFIFRGVSRET